MLNQHRIDIACYLDCIRSCTMRPCAVSSYKLPCIIRFGLVETSISTDHSSNYRGIALNSPLGKMLDHILLTNYKNVFQTSDRQFGFKAKHSTVQCIINSRHRLSQSTSKMFRVTNGINQGWVHHLFYFQFILTSCYTGQQTLALVV